MHTITKSLLIVVAGFWIASAHANDIAAAAQSQIGVTLRYDPAYKAIPFPNGDVPPDRGVCTDVVVRALRVARRLDLQREVNADMTAHWNTYPHKWSQLHPDPNIDHRRVPNLMTYFAHRGYVAPVSSEPKDYAAGDIVAWNLGGDILHIGIVSDKNKDGRPLIIHNIGSGAREEDVLTRYKVIGHYRLPAKSDKPQHATTLSR